MTHKELAESFLAAMTEGLGYEPTAEEAFVVMSHLDHAIGEATVVVRNLRLAREAPMANGNAGAIPTV
jgi:hypothetical protein